MNQHASMNRIFRLVWNESLKAYVPVAETARGRGKSSKRKVIAAALSLSASIAQAGPTGGQVTGGNGTITQSGSTTTIQQSSQNLSLNWQTFNISSRETVDFVQPNASAIAVNRILSPNGSVILGHLNANGEVYLINPNGILFGKGAEVNVGGLIASTLNMNDGSLNDTSKTFSGAGAGSVINDGTLTAATGGAVALLGNRVSNNGVISAQLGTVALGAGSVATLTFRGTNLLSMQIDQSVLNSVAANGGLIRAAGGEVLMSAGAQKALLASVVNNTGIIEARTLENHEGTITLLGGMSSGTVSVAGTLDASAPNGGNGGYVETSAARVEIANSARVTTAAAMGLNGTWLIDPTDFTISAGTTAQSASGIGAATLQNELAGTNVSIATSAGGTQNGDINVNAPVSWSSNTLTLTAANNINVNAVMTVSGTAKADFEPGTGTLLMGFAPDGTFAGRVDISSGAANALTIAGQVYTVINGLGVAGDSATAPATATLQGVAAPANLSGNFALGSNIDAAATSNWNSGAGFTPIGTSTPFSGQFEGLGHLISGLTINLPSTSTVGLFSKVGSQVAPAGSIRNIGLVGGSVAGGSTVGFLVGISYGTISNSYAGGGVSGTEGIGGLVGTNAGSVSRSHATGNVNGTAFEAGGLVGGNFGTISDSSATGTVIGNAAIGGLVGFNGNSTGLISDSYATGNVTSTGDYAGGLVGLNVNGSTIENAYATGNVSAQHDAGGLVGLNDGSTITNTYATGSVSGLTYIGGLLGYNSGTVTNSYAVGSVSGNSYSGSLIGSNYGTVTNSFYNLARNPTLTGTATDGGPLADVPGSIVGMTSTQLQAQANFTSATSANGSVNPGWDLNGNVAGSSAWFMYEGETMPLLRVFMTPLTVSGTMTQTYDRLAFAPDLADLTYSITPTPGHLLGTLTVNGNAQGAVHAGIYSFTLGGLYSDQQGYLISYASSTLTITPATLTVTGTGVSQKVYDGTTVATLTGGSLVGVIGGDAVSLTQAGQFASPHAGTGIAVSASDDIGGSSASDYFIVEPTGLFGTITPAPLTVTGTGVSHKVYDGTTVATLTGGSLVGVIGGDSVSLTQAGQFASPHAGTGIAVSASDGIGGSSASDYFIVEPTGLFGTITPAPLTVTGTSVNPKVYDGTTVATLRGGSLMGVIGGDSVSLTQAGQFASATAGPRIAVTADDTLSGPSAGDYSIEEPTGLTGSILPVPGGGSSDLLLAALNARTQIVANFIYSQFGENPQVINASPTITVLATSATDVSNDAADSQQATVVNVSMKVGATGTLKIENGGLRLPSNLVVGNE